MGNLLEEAANKALELSGWLDKGERPIPEVDFELISLSVMGTVGGK